ncbi:MAG: DinB family protein [Flavobacterium sp.]
MNDRELIIKMALDSWKGQINAIDKVLGKLSDEQLMQEVSSMRNRGIYLLGHLTAVHDLMLPLLRFEEANYPELQPIFIDAPDKAIVELPSILQLRNQWKEVNAKLFDYYASLTPAEWFTRHSNVSDGDFLKEPHRNRLNVLLGRVMHLSYHRGQLVLLTNRTLLC